MPSSPATEDHVPQEGSSHDNGGRAPDEETPLLGPPATEEPSERVVIQEDISTKRLVVILGSIYVGVFLGALDSTVIATLSAPIATSFNSLNLLSWIATAYLIANSVCQPLTGRLTDIFGRGTGLVISNVLFAGGNLICGFAQTEWTMIVGRVIAGMGGGGLMAISTFVASDLVPLRQRGIIQGIGNLCFGSGAGLGGLFGGWVHGIWGWRVAFLAQVPFSIVSGILVFLTVKIPPKQSDKSKLSRIDFPGAFTLLITLLLLLLGLNSGGNIVPWTHPLVLVTLPLSAVFLIVYILVEMFWAKEPIIPVRLFSNRTVAAGCLTNWFTTMTIFSLFFYIPIYFQIKGRTTMEAGIRFIPGSIATALSSLGSGYVMKKTGKYRLLGLCVMILITLGSCLLCTLSFDSPDWSAVLFLTIAWSGYGGMLTVTLLAIISAVDHEHQAVVTSASYAFRSTGSTIGITIASAVYQNVLNSQLWDKFGQYPNADEEIRRIRDNLDSLKSLPEGWKDGVYDSYMASLRAVFITCVGMAALAFITQGFIKQHTLHSTLTRK